MSNLSKLVLFLAALAVALMVWGGGNVYVWQVKIKSGVLEGSTVLTTDSFSACADVTMAMHKAGVRADCHMALGGRISALGIDLPR